MTFAEHCLMTLRNVFRAQRELAERALAHTAQHSGQIVMLAKHWRGEAWETLLIPRGASETFEGQGEAEGEIRTVEPAPLRYARPMPYADLHMHTRYSDGRSSPNELLAAARQRGLSALAITDHETTRGSREAWPIAQSQGLELIPAIELTCSWEGYTGHGGGPDIDILGYFIDLDSPRLARLEAARQDALKARAEDVCARLTRAGYRLGLDDVLAVNPHFSGFLTIHDALASKLNRPSEAAHVLRPFWRDAPPLPLTIAETISSVHAVGGVAVLAHPSIIHRDSDGEPLSERSMSALVEMGLDGVEVLHYRLSSPQRRHFALLARMFGLPISGGSDEHGGPTSFPRLGREDVTREMVEALRERQKAGV